MAVLKDKRKTSDLIAFSRPFGAGTKTGRCRALGPAVFTVFGAN
jgi:hypothetical protein